MKTTLRVARVPYLNTEPFFPEDLSTLPFTVVALPPRQLGEAALRGEIDAGPMAVVDYFRLSDRFEPLADLGIAARGEAQSVLLLSQRPLVQLHGSVIDVTSDTSTSVVLLRLLLEERYHIVPSDYRRLNGATGAAEARLVIGDEALRLRRQDRRMPYLIDLGMEWWLWQLLPFVFARWVVRTDVPAQAKAELAQSLQDALEQNVQAPEAIAARRADALGLSVADISQYVQSFRYRLDAADHQGMARFRELLHAKQLL